MIFWLPALLLASCIPGGTNASGPVFSGSFYALVDGSGFTGTSNNATIGEQTLSITASCNDSARSTTVIKLDISRYKGVAVYPIDTATSASYQQRDTLYGARSGKITVTTADNSHIAGTFSFAAVRLDGHSKNVSAGKFDIYR